MTNYFNEEPANENCTNFALTHHICPPCDVVICRRRYGHFPTWRWRLFQGKDTFVDKSQPNTNFGSFTGFAVGNLGEADEQHAAIGFDGVIGNGLGQIPLGSTINSAVLGIANSHITTPNLGSVHEILIPWFEGFVTWNNMLGGVNNGPLGEYDPTPTYSGGLGGGPFNVMSIVQSWANGGDSWGFVILPTATGNISSIANEFPGIPQNHPYLRVDFTPPVPEPTTAAALLIGASICMVRIRTPRYPNATETARPRLCRGLLRTYNAACHYWLL